MFSKKKRQLPMMIPNPGINPYMTNPYQGQVNSNLNYDISRLETEIQELKRQNSEVLKRLTKLENYLGVRKDESITNNSLF